MREKVAICLSTMGPAAYHTLANFLAPSTPAQKNYSILIQSMEKFYSPKPSVIVQRYQFYSCFRKPDESTATFVAELRCLAKDCNFGQTLQENLRERLVCGVNDQVYQKRLHFRRLLRPLKA